MKKIFLLPVTLLLIFSIWGCGTQDTDTSTSNPLATTSIGSSLGPFTDLGDLEGPTGPNWLFTQARAINNNGTIVGKSKSVYRAFSWDQGTEVMTDLGRHAGYYDDFYGGAGSSPFAYSHAVDINNQGTLGKVIVNSTTEATSGSEFTEKRAFIYDLDTSTATDIAPFVNGTMYNYSEAVAINDNGYVLVNVGDSNTTTLAYYWDGSSTVFSATAGGNVPRLEAAARLQNATTAKAVAINDNNQMVINSGGNAIYYDPALDFGQTLNQIFGDSGSEAVDINNSSQVVGTSGSLGFFWEAGSMIRIDSLGGANCTPKDINNASVVVGDADNADGDTHAFMWKLVNGKPVTYDLGTLGGANSHAVAINDAGLIVGYSDTGETYVAGSSTYTVQHAFIWRNGVMYDLGVHNDFYNYPFIDSYPYSEIVDLNDSGAVAGNSYSPNANYRGFYFDPVYP